MKNAAILARVSREQQKIDSQIQDLVNDIAKYQYSLSNDNIFQEQITGMDSFEREERESLKRLKEAIESKSNIDAVFIWELTRLSRNPYYLINELSWFNQHQIPIFIHKMSMWTRDPNTNEENLNVTNIIFSIATYGQQEWFAIKERMKRGRDYKASKGLFVGHLADGYCVTLVDGEKHIAIDEIRADIVRKIFNLYVNDGKTQDEISALLNNESIPTAYAYRAEKNINNPKFKQDYLFRKSQVRMPKSAIVWTGSAIGQLLKCEWYIGKRKYNGITYSCPQIVSEEIFKLAQAKMKKCAHSGRKSTRLYPLSGLLFCECGQQMYGHAVHINSSYYCKSIESGKKCGAEGICKENIDAIVWQHVYDLVSKEKIQKYQNSAITKNFTQIITEKYGVSEKDKEKLLKEKDEICDKLVKINDAISAQMRLIQSLISKLNNADDIIKQIFDEKINETRQKNTQMLGEKESFEQRLNEIDKTLTDYDKLMNNPNIFENLSKIQNEKDIKTAMTIIKMMVQRVELRQMGRNYKLIVIYMRGGQQFLKCYNINRYKGQFIDMDKFWKYYANTNTLMHKKIQYTFDEFIDSYDFKKNTRPIVRIEKQSPNYDKYKEEYSRWREKTMERKQQKQQQS